MTQPTAQSRSGLQIQGAKVRVGKELKASGYLYADSIFILSAISGIAESGPVLVHKVTDSDENIGRSICEKLTEFGTHPIPNAREYRVADWGAFVASGAKSAKQFEAEALYFGFSTMNTAIILTARPRLSLEQSFYFAAQLSTGTEHEVIGQSLRKLVSGVRLLRDGGVI